MSNKKVLAITAAVAAILILGSCKRLYFHVTEENRGGASNRFVLKKAHYQMGKSVAITGGRFQLVPSDSIVLYIEGQGTVTGVGEAGVATLDFAETTRFYIVLPTRLSVKKYDVGNRAICEITGSLGYNPGENLFVCQSGEVVIDSLKKEKIFGTFAGKYINTRNQSMTVDGRFKAGLK